MSALSVHQSSLAPPASDLSIRFASWPERLSIIKLVAPLDALIVPRLALSEPVTVAPAELIVILAELLIERFKTWPDAELTCVPPDEFCLIAQLLPVDIS